MKLSDYDREILTNIIKQGHADRAIDQCIEMCMDKLASVLFEHGGFATLQITSEGEYYTLRFVKPEETYQVNQIHLRGGFFSRGGQTPISNPTETL